MSQPLHIAVDVNNLFVDSRGMGRYVRTLLGDLIPRSAAVRWTLLTKRFPGFDNKAKLRSLLHVDNFKVASRVPQDVDLIWHPWNGTIFPSPVPSVVTMHDAVPFAYPSSDHKLAALEQAPFIRSAQTASKILTVSHFAKHEIERWLNFSAQNIIVTHLAVAPHFTPGPPNISPELQAQLRGRPYIFAVGAPDERKNLNLLHRAWQAAFPNAEVALVGTGFDLHQHAGSIALSRTRDDELLRDLYRGAQFVAYPSLYEGFGLPVLEAMACGVPVLAFAGTSVHEIGGDAAYWMHTPDDVSAWAAALCALHEDDALRGRLISLGLIHNTKFSWKTTADTTLATLLETAQVAA